MFSYLSPEKRVPQDHALRGIRAITDPALKELSPEFDRLHAANGRPSKETMFALVFCCNIRTESLNGIPCKPRVG